MSSIETPALLYFSASRPVSVPPVSGRYPASAEALALLFSCVCMLEVTPWTYPSSVAVVASPSSLLISAAVAVMPSDARVVTVSVHGTLTYICPKELSFTP